MALELRQQLMMVRLGQRLQILATQGQNMVGLQKEQLQLLWRLV